MRRKAIGGYGTAARIRQILWYDVESSEFCARYTSIMMTLERALREQADCRNYCEDQALANIEGGIVADDTELHNIMGRVSRLIASH